MSTNVDLVIKDAEQIVTSQLNNNIIDKSPLEKFVSALIMENRSIAIKDGIILDIGTYADLETKYNLETADIIDAQGKLVLPGFVDSHTHAIFAGSRDDELELKLQGYSYLDILKKGGGILRTVRATRAASLEDLVEQTCYNLDLMLLHGTTTAELKSGYGLTTESELKMLQAMKLANEKHPIEIVPTFLGAHAIPEGSSSEAYTQHILDDMLPAVKEQNIAKFCDVFCEKDVFSVEQSRKILLKAKELGLIPKIHADEIYPLGGAELAAEIGAVSADHLLASTDEGLQKMAEKHVVPIVLPGVPVSLFQTKFARARTMIDRWNMPVALASDLNPNCFLPSMLLAITFSCFHMKLKPLEAIQAATIHGAAALKMHDKIGALKPGYAADLLILDVPNYRYIPYMFGTNVIEYVIKSGRIVVKNRQLVYKETN